MIITNELIDKIAELGRLKIKDADKPKLSEQLTEILEHMRVLDEIDVTGVEPMFHACMEKHELRLDEVKRFDADAIMSNACQKENHYFAVPNIIAGEDE